MTLRLRCADACSLKQGYLGNTGMTQSTQLPPFRAECPQQVPEARHVNCGMSTSPAWTTSGHFCQQLSPTSPRRNGSGNWSSYFLGYALGCKGYRTLNPRIELWISTTHNKLMRMKNLQKWTSENSHKEKKREHGSQVQCSWAPGTIQGTHLHSPKN